MDIRKILIVSILFALSLIAKSKAPVFNISGLQGKGRWDYYEYQIDSGSN